ncbi:MAG: SHOCT domain-containing protein [Acidimicrobiia bacterium]
MLFLLRPRQARIPYAPPRRPAPPPAPPPAADPVTRLKDLAALHDSGALTDDEFATAKRIVLASEP